MHEGIQPRGHSSTCTHFNRSRKAPPRARPKSSRKVNPNSASSPADPQSCFQIHFPEKMDEPHSARSLSGQPGSARNQNSMSTVSGATCIGGDENSEPSGCEGIANDVQLSRRLFRFWEAEDAISRRNFEEATTSPPISAASLRELELSCIMNNARLRHDINFDRELHFRPNLDGSRGKEKLRATNAFWDAIAVELRLFVFFLTDPGLQTLRWTSPWVDAFRQAQRRVPPLFHAVRDVLARLMPDAEQKLLSEAFDVPLILQQIEHGIFDLSGLSQWLGTMLKAHCAPMRDKLVDETVASIAAGAEGFETGDIIRGFRGLFGVLEAMKLDVANHQIRYMRPTLLENTITFEQTYFVSKIEAKQIDLDSAIKWYKSRETPVLDVFEAPLASRSRFAEPPSPMNSFIASLVYAIVPPPGEQPAPLPDTFRLDIERLKMLVLDSNKLVFTAICHELLSVLVNYERIEPAGFEKARLLLNSFLSSAVIPHVGESIWFSKIGNIAIEMATIIDQCASKGGDASSEARSDFSDVINARYEYSVRYLDANFRRSSPIYAQKSSDIRYELLKGVVQLAKQHQAKSPLAVFEALAPTKRQKGTQVFSPHRFLEEISERLAHVCILHWWVWSPIICSDGIDEERTYQAGDGESPLLPTQPNTSTGSTPQAGQVSAQAFPQAASSVQTMSGVDAGQALSSPRQPPPPS